MKLLYCRAEILHYLTSTCIRFVVDRDAPKEKLCDWWCRIHNCRLEFTDRSRLELWRDYDRKTDLARSKTRLQNAIAQLHIISANSLEPSTFHADAADAICSLNDNDFYGFAADPDGREVQLESRNYELIQRRKARQYRGIIRSAEPTSEIENTEQGADADPSEEAI